MSDNSKLICEWQDKVKNSFGDEARLYDYLFETMENFFYRYLETTENKNLKVQELAPHCYGTFSLESSMVEALKISNPPAKAGIMELAKSVPKAQKPLVRYSLQSQTREFTADKGHLVITSAISWDFPTFKDPAKSVQKKIDFKYQELIQFRKELALKLEEACELFN